MSENVDFRRIARFIAATDQEDLIIDFLRDVWNARGTADGHLFLTLRKLPLDVVAARRGADRIVEAGQ